MFGSGKKQIIKLDQSLCNANVDNNEVLFIRVPGIVTDKDARVEVPFTHRALLLKGGGDLRYYESGTYDIFEDKKEVKKWKSGESVEVIYMPKDTRVLVPWGTRSPILYRDDVTDLDIRVRVNGELDLEVSNPEQFFRKVVGSTKEFELQAFRRRFSLTIGNEFVDLFLKVVREKNLTYDKFMEYQKEIGNRVSELLDEMFKKEWGMSVQHLQIIQFTFDEDDIEKVRQAMQTERGEKKIKDYLKEVERLDDKNWEREKYLRRLELEDNAAYYEVMKYIGEKDAKDAKAKKDNGSMKKLTKFCPNCGEKYEEGMKFCQGCGRKLGEDKKVCQNCNKVNNADARFCADCGSKLD